MTGYSEWVAQLSLGERCQCSGNQHRTYLQEERIEDSELDLPTVSISDLFKKCASEREWTRDICLSIMEGVFVYLRLEET